MLKIILYCFIFSGLILPILPVYAAPELRIEPPVIVQGEHFKVEISDNELSKDNNENIFLDINNKQIPLFFNSDKTLRAFIALPADISPGEYPLKLMNKNKEYIFESKVYVRKGNFGEQNIRFYRPPLSKQQEEKIKMEDALVEDAKGTISMEQLWEDSFVLPVNNRVSGIFGIRRYLNGKYNGYHGGIDFASPVNTPVKAVNMGRVILARYFSKYNSNGNIVFLDHGQGVTSCYLHLSKINVKEGKIVKKGSIIGYVGNSGRSTGPHLHWGIYLNGQNTDGLNWVKYSKIFSGNK